MIQLPYPDLSKEATFELAVYQKEIDDQPNYPDKVAAAKAKFGVYNKKGNAVFAEVKKHLNAMACGAERCHYCEDSKADEVEHIFPKTWYPERCFVWENYCYACGSCNGPKSNDFAVYRELDGAYYEFPKRGKDEIPSPPPAGKSVLINPRTENPLDFLFLDIANTFAFTEYAAVGTKEHQRATYTIKLLGLNERAYSWSVLERMVL